MGTKDLRPQEAFEFLWKRSSLHHEDMKTSLLPRPARSSRSAISRRQFVGGAAALLAGARLLRAKRFWAAAEGPETTDMRFGMIALTDCSPIVIAHEKGLFKKYGINSTVVEGRQLGGHPRLALQRRHPGHAHADRHAASRRRWACSARQEADGHSVAAQPQRPGHHAEERAARARCRTIRRR